MVSIELTKEDLGSIGDLVVEEICKKIQPERILSIILYGSSLASGTHIPKDMDILILLDSYVPSDLTFVSQICKKYPVELFLDYKDQIEQKGINFYQRGRHGSYFVACLASAKVLYGRNYYRESLPLVSEIYIKKDLMYRIEEYFYRIQKMIINDTVLDIENIEKYLSRICTDLLLFSGELSFESVHTVHYKDVLRKNILTSSLFTQEVTSLIQNFLTSQQILQVAELLGPLHKIYLTCFDNLKKDDII